MVTCENAWLVSDTAEFSATKPTVPLVVSFGILISPFRPLNTVAPDANTFAPVFIIHHLSIALK